MERNHDVSTKYDYDLIIIGGGMVGATLACALREQSLHIGIIEAYPFGSPEQSSYDDRSIALSYGSQQIFAGMGLWETFSTQATPIHHIHISNRGHFGVARLDRRESRVDALGYVIENRIVGRLLSERIATHDNIDLITPARLSEIAINRSHAVVTYEKNNESQQITAPLVVGADGAMSQLRELLGIEIERREYEQSAIIANVSTEQAHNSVAYERFTDTGPIALLPLGQDRCSLVWTVKPDDVEKILQMEDVEFLSLLQHRFGYRLGRFLRVGKRTAYPLALIRAEERVTSRVVLVGNAAHTLHPVAGQGFNLGVRDVAGLAQMIVDKQKEGLDYGTLRILNEYAQWREQDHRQIIAFTDTMARLFTNAFPPVVIGRNLGLLALDLMPPVKKIFAKRTMGMAGRLPRLARGIPL